MCATTARRTTSPISVRLLPVANSASRGSISGPAVWPRMRTLTQRLIEQLAEEVAAERAADVVDRQQRDGRPAATAPSRFSVSSSSLPVEMTGHGSPVAMAAASWVR